MSKTDDLYLAIRKIRDRRVDSLWDDLRSAPYRMPLSLDMGRALLALALLAIVIGWIANYFKNIRLDAILFFGVQWYIVICSFILTLPFFVKLLHINADVREQASLTVKNKNSKLLRFFVLVLGVYALLFILIFIKSSFTNDDLLKWHNFHSPTLNELLITLFERGTNTFYLTWLGGTVCVWLFIELYSFFEQQCYKSRYRTTSNPERYPFGLWLGKTTGILAKLSHGAGIAAGKALSLGWRDATQNIVITGGTGSGKTTQVVHPILVQLLDQGCGGLIFDIKGNFANAVKTFANVTGNSNRLFLIGPEHLSINLIEGLTPEVAASFLKSSSMLNGSSGDVNRFFTDTASELCRMALGVLSFIPEEYNLHGLYNYIFDEEHQKAINQQVDTLLSLKTLSPEQEKLLMGYRKYREQTFDRFDERLKGSVLASVAHVLSPFNHPTLIDAFCQSTECNLENALNGSIFLVQLPIATWGLGAKVADNFIKLRFFNVMQQRELREEWDQNRLVFFMCDEYQEIVSASKEGLSDLNFWDKSRSSKTIGIISTQSIKSFYAAIGDRDCAGAILQNFRQKLCFRTEDQETLDYLNRLTGRVEVEKVTESKQSGSSSSTSHGGGNSHRSRTRTVTKVEKQILDPQLIRNLKPTQAVALLIVDGYSRDDVLDTEAIYL